DFLEYQPSKAEVKAGRKANAERQAGWRDKRRNAVTNGVSNAVSNGHVTSPPYPDPGSVPSESEKIAAPAANGCAERQVYGLVSSLAESMSMNGHKGPLAPIMSRVKPEVEALPKEKQATIYRFVGWLFKTGIRDDECLLRFVADAIPRL